VGEVKNPFAWFQENLKEWRLYLSETGEERTVRIRAAIQAEIAEGKTDFAKRIQAYRERDQMIDHLARYAGLPK